MFEAASFASHLQRTVVDTIFGHVSPLSIRLIPYRSQLQIMVNRYLSLTKEGGVKMKRLWTVCLAMLFLPITALATLPIGEVPPVITLEGDAGGRVDGTPWSSAEMKGKVYYLVYVDPDETEMNAHVEKAMKEIDLPRDKFQSVAVINMDATWLPNMAIASKLEDKQEEYPDTIYVKDMDGALVKQWNLADDAYDVVVVGVDGKVLFSVDGKLSDSQVQELLTLLQEKTR